MDINDYKASIAMQKKFLKYNTYTVFPVDGCCENDLSPLYIDKYGMHPVFEENIKRWALITRNMDREALGLEPEEHITDKQLNSYIDQVVEQQKARAIERKLKEHKDEIQKIMDEKG